MFAGYWADISQPRASAVNLHIPTMFVMILVATSIMAVALGSLAFRKLPDLRSWSLSLLLQVVAYVLFSLRGQVSDIWSIVVANACITASVALYGVGLYQFHHRQPPRWLLAAPVMVCIAGFLIWIGDYRARVAIASGLWLLQVLYLLGLLVAFRAKTAGRGQYILGAAAVLFAGTQAYRLFAVLGGTDSSVQFTDATPPVVASYFSSLACTLLLAVGALTMIQERYEQALRGSEERYRKLVDYATQGICVLQDDRFRFVNPKTLELLGYNEAELVNQPLFSLIHPDDQGLAKANHALRLEGKGEGLTYPLRMHTRQQGWRWFEISGVLFDWHGRPATLNFLADVTERLQAAEQMRELAYHDTLTHLPNRRLLLDHLTLARAAYERSGKHGALVFIDLDNFKPLNDLHGHAVGDLLLIEVAQRLLHTIRGADTAARFGGDEFVVLLTQLSEDAATARTQTQQFAEKLLSVLGQPYLLSTELNGVRHTVEHHCTGTAGVVVFNGNGESNEALLDRADAAMYEAKQAGRNCMRFSEGRLGG